MNLKAEEQAYISESEKALGSQKIWKLFLHYAVPGVIGLLFVGIQSIVDGLMVGNFLGSDALAGVSLILPCYSLAVALAVVIGIGSQTIVSISLGEKNYQRAQDAMTTGFVSVLAISLLFTFLMLYFQNGLARLLGANDNLLPHAVGYIRGLVPFMPVLTTMFYSDFMIKSIGKPRYAMAITSASVLLNVLFNWLFIKVWGYGTMGTGLATGVAFSAGAVFSYFIIFNPQNIISVAKGKFRLNYFRQMLYNGSSEGLTEFAAGISTFLFNITLMRLAGENGVAAFTVINYVFFVGTTVFLGISDGIIPIISFNYGARQIGRVKQAFNLGIRTNCMIGVILFTILFFFSRPIITLFFDNTSGQVIEMASHGASIYAFAFLASGLNILSSSFFTSLANAKLSVVIALLRGVIFLFAGIYLLPFIWGLDGVWVAIPLAEGVTLLISYILVRRKLKTLT
ncbi:MAG: MATE family efflux transporter [Bacteroidales bacterium]